MNVVIYHKDCFDGMAAAWAVNKYLREKGIVEIQLVPATYGDIPPNVIDKTVTIVDFSYPQAVLNQMIKEARSLIVLDHHKTAEEDLKGFPHAVFDMHRSGAGIAWDWFFLGRPRHWLIDCIEDRDLWRFNHPLTKKQMGWISTVPFTLEAYEELSEMDPQVVATKGEGILKYIHKYGLKAIDHAVMRDIGGYAFWIINISYQNCSEHLDLMMDQKGFDRAAYFFLRDDGKWQFGLRSRGVFDVASIAKKYGGGGHKNASGFTVDELPWTR